jgi:hypothetical protein
VVAAASIAACAAFSPRSTDRTASLIAVSILVQRGLGVRGFAVCNCFWKTE